MNFVKFKFAEMIIWLYSYNLLIWWIVLILFQILNTSHISVITLIWSWFCLLVLSTLVIQFANIFFSNFAFMFLSEIDPHCFLSYYCIVLIWDYPRIVKKKKRVTFPTILYSETVCKRIICSLNLLKFICETIFSFPVSWGYGNRVEKEETLISFFRLSISLWVRFGKLRFF